MALPVPYPGLVIRYSYLWYSEAVRGSEEGVKDRPCAIVLASQGENGETLVTVVPITHTFPDKPDEAIEIPIQTKKRLGLDSERSWIIVSEVNRFIWPGPDLRSISSNQPGRYEFGALPPRLFRQVKEKLLRLAKYQKINPVGRIE